MGMLDQVIGDFMGNNGAAGSPLDGVLRSVIGGTETSGQGLSGLVSGFEQAGLGHIVQSWIGTGPNQPVSPQQLQSVMGGDQVQSMASQSGMAPQDLLSELSQHLPGLINHLTPNGQMPDAGTVTV